MYEYSGKTWCGKLLAHQRKIKHSSNRVNFPLANTGFVHDSSGKNALPQPFGTIPTTRSGRLARVSRHEMPNIEILIADVWICACTNYTNWDLSTLDWLRTDRFLGPVEVGLISRLALDPRTLIGFKTGQWRSSRPLKILKNNCVGRDNRPNVD